MRNYGILWDLWDFDDFFWVNIGDFNGDFNGD